MRSVDYKRPASTGAGRRCHLKARLHSVMIRSVWTIWLFAIVFSDAAKWHVATSGNDVNPGSESHPFRTLAAAMDRAQAGDTAKVRGISFEDVGTTEMLLSNMRMGYSFVANDVLFGGVSNTEGIRFLAQGDGKIELMLRKDNGNSTIYNNRNMAVSGITGFDLTLVPGTGNTAYSITVYNSGTDVTTSGTLAMTAADWFSAVPNTSRISLAANESVTVTDTNQKFTVYTDSLRLFQSRRQSACWASDRSLHC